MSSTQGFHARSVFMCQGTSQLRVSSSAELKIAAGAQFMMDYEMATGRSGTVSNRGISYVLSTAVGSSFYLRAPVRGAKKTILVRTKAATSGFIKIRTTGKTITVGRTSWRSINLASSHGKIVPAGHTVELLGATTAHWLILGVSKNTTGIASLITFTSSTGI